MKKFFLSTAGIAAGIVIIVLFVWYATPAKGPTETLMFEFDVPTRDNHIIAVEVTVDYHQKNTEVLLTRDEMDDRVYSNLFVAFRLATMGVSFEDIKDDDFRGEVDKSIAYFNNAPYEIVEIDTENLEYSLTYDPPAEPEDDSSDVVEDLPREGASTRPPDFRQMKGGREIPI